MVEYANSLSFLAIFLQSIRTEENYKQWWQKIKKEAEEIGIDEPRLLRKRRAPQRFDDHSSTGNYHSSPEDHYRAIYFEALDATTSCIQNRLLIRGDTGSENDDLFDLYHDDFNRSILEAQLSCFHSNYSIKEDIGIADIIQLLKDMSVAVKSLFSQVIRVARTLSGSSY